VWRYVANGIIGNAMHCSQNRDLKCNRICKLPVSLSCLSTFYDPYSSFLNYQFLHYLVNIISYTSWFVNSFEKLILAKFE